jgi:hypothetical protein
MELALRMMFIEQLITDAILHSNERLDVCMLHQDDAIGGMTSAGTSSEAAVIGVDRFVSNTLSDAQSNLRLVLPKVFWAWAHKAQPKWMEMVGFESLV